MVHDDIASIIAMRTRIVHMHDRAVCNGADFVERFVGIISMDWPDINPFVKSGVDYTYIGTPLVTREPVSTALPWLRVDALEVAIGVHVKPGRVRRKDRIVIGS